MSGLGRVGSLRTQTEDGKVGLLGRVTPDSQATMGTVKALGYLYSEQAKAFPVRVQRGNNNSDDPNVMRNMQMHGGVDAMHYGMETALRDFPRVANSGGLESFRYGRPTAERAIRRSGQSVVGGPTPRAPSQHQGVARNVALGSDRAFA